MSRRCVLYARLSVTKEESVSIARQLESCRIDDLRLRQVEMMLALAVPLEMRRLRNAHPDVLIDLAAAAGTRLASNGDALYFHDRSPEAKGLVSELARGIAAAALTARGGVTYRGLHWCADHAECDAPAVRRDDPPHHLLGADQ